jgi:hypothetical protein
MSTARLLWLLLPYKGQQFLQDVHERQLGRKPLQGIRPFGYLSKISCHEELNIRPWFEHCTELRMKSRSSLFG